MSNKPEAQTHVRFFRKLLAGGRSFFSTIPEQSIIDASAGVLIVIVISLLLLHYQRPTVEPLAVGTVATADILAPVDVRADDAAETSKRRAQAAAAIPPVYDFNQRSNRDARISLEQMFSYGRDSAGGLAASQVRDGIEKESGIILDDDQVEVLIRHRFNSELEKLMIDHLESVSMSGVLASRNQVVRLGSGSFVRRDIKSGQEITVSNLSQVQDLITARAALRSDKLVWPAEYDMKERRMLGEVLGALLVPNLIFNEAETESRKNAAKESVVPVTVKVEKGKPVVSHGETVTPVKAALLEAAASHRPFSERAVEFSGTMIVVMLLLLVLWQYMVRYQFRHLRVRRHFLLHTTVFLITLALARLFFTLAAIFSQWAEHVPFKSQQSYEYMAPVAIGAVLVTLLTDGHAAFVFSSILSVFIGMVTGDFVMSAYTMLGSVGAIYHLKGCRDRTTLVVGGFWIGGVNMAAALALDFLGANQPQVLILLFDMLCGFLSGMIAATGASMLLPLFEWAFGISTDIKLLELSNLNLPLLKRLAERAPGTYHHSIMVGLLAEAAAESIGADSLFARVACYYHDIGKMVRPTYFIENQSYMDNRHDRLAPKMSSIVLSNHVKQGLELAREYKLPPRVTAIIPQHHGTGLMKFFYSKAVVAADGPEAAALEQEFRYPGPKPQTKEAAIIMIADSVEAAGRTVKDPTPAKLRNMIDSVIVRMRDDGQFDESNITMKELRTVADSFVKVLIGIHHHRIEYPGYNFNQTGDTENTAPNSIREKAANGGCQKVRTASGAFRIAEVSPQAEVPAAGTEGGPHES